MTYVLQPFLHLVFAESVLPTVHLFVSATEKLVAGYCPFVAESAYSDHKLSLHPFAIKWGYERNYLITILTAVETKFIQKTIRKILKDETAYLTLVAPRESLMECWDQLKNLLSHTVFEFAVNGTWFRCVILSGNRMLMRVWDGRTRELTEQDAKDSEVGLIYPADQPTTALYKFQMAVKDSMVVQRKDMDAWWADWKATGLENNPYVQLNREEFARPRHSKHLYASNEQEITWPPGVKRFLAAPALPPAHSDEKSARIMNEVIRPNWELFQVSTRLDVDKLEEVCEGLPNEEHWRSYINAFREGGNPWLSSFQNDGPAGVSMGNARLSAAEWAFVYQQRDEEVRQGHWSRAFYKRLEFMRTSPLAVASKPGKAKYRLIQNASAPRGNSYNDNIRSEDSALKLDTISDLIGLMRRYHAEGKHKVLWVLDISAYFRHFPLHPLAALRNCVMIEQNGVESYHVDRRACFGGRSNPRYCSDFGDILIMVLFQKGKVEDAFHYIDDYFGASDWNGEMGYPDSMYKLMALFDKLNIPYSKPQMADTIHPLGLTITYSTGELKLQTKKLVKYVSAIRFTLTAPDNKVAYGDLEKLRGQLSWCLCVVAEGVTHNRALHELLFKYSKLRSKEYRVKLTLEARESLRWWNQKLSAGPVRYIYEEKHWDIKDADELVFTDASSTEGLGLYMAGSEAGYFHEFTKDALPWKRGEEKPVHINALELLAIVCAVSIVASGYAGPAKVAILSDSHVACRVIARMDARTEASTRLLRILAQILEGGIDLRVMHVVGKANPADGLSRGRKGIARAVKEVPMRSLTEFEPSMAWLQGEDMFCERGLE